MIGNPKRYRVVREQLLQIRLHAPHGVLDHAHVHLITKSVKNFLFLEIRKISREELFGEYRKSIAELEVSNMERFSGGRHGEPVPEVHRGRTILVLRLMTIKTEVINSGLKYWPSP